MCAGVTLCPWEGFEMINPNKSVLNLAAQNEVKFLLPSHEAFKMLEMSCI